jgi:hypothetical protein
VSYTCVPDGGSLRIGLRARVANSAYWACFDNFRLYFYGGGTPDIPTDIDTLLAGEPTEGIPTDTAVYDLQGRRIADTLEGLPRGIYIVGGRKVLKK